MKFTDFHNSELAEASKTRNPTRDFLRNNPVSPDEMAKPVKQMSVPELAAISDEALDNEYHYGRSTPGNTFGWQANLKSAAFAKQMIDKGVTDIEQISDAIHKGWNVTAQAFVQNPDQFDDTEKLKAAGKLEAKLQQRAKLMNIEYAQLPDDEQEKDRVVARALLQAIKGQQGVAEGGFDNASPMTKDTVKADRIRSLKNLIAIAKEQERQLRVQELELELKKLQGVAEARIETIHGSAYTIDPNKYYVWAWDNAVVLYGEYTDENDAELNLSKIERRATKRLGPAVKGRFEVASGKMLLRQYGNEQGVAEGLKQTLRRFDPTIKARIRGKSQDQTNQGLDTIQHLADLDLTSDDMVSRAMKPNTYFRNAERYAKLANKGMAEDELDEVRRTNPLARKLRDLERRQGALTKPVEQMFHVKTDQYGANKDVPLYTKTYSVRANSEQEAINTVIKIFGGTNHRIEQGVAEAKADPLGAWIAHKNGTEARKFKTREGAKKYVASHDGFTVSSSEAFHDTYRKKKVQEVKKFRTTYGWAGGSKEPRSAHAKQVATKRNEYEKGLGKFEPTDNMVGTAKVTKGVAEAQLDEGAVDKLKELYQSLVSKVRTITNFKQYYDAAKLKQQEVVDAIKTSKNAEELKQKIAAIAEPAPVMEEFDPPPATASVAALAVGLFETWAAQVVGVYSQMAVGTGADIVGGLMFGVLGQVGCIGLALYYAIKANQRRKRNQDVAEGEKWIQKAVNPKTKGNLHKALHVPQDETIPKSRIAQAIHSADPHLRRMAQFAKNVAKEDAGGMGTGSVATSMGAGNGFANGGPGTITRRRK